MYQFQCDAILFDLDGVLVNSNAAVERHWRDWAAAHGLDAEAILKMSHGRPAIETVQLVAPHLVAEDEAKILSQQEVEDLAGVIEVEGVANLLASLPNDRWAVVTSGTWAIATTRLQHVGLPIPQVLVTADDVTYGKPNPEGYLQAAQRLGFAPEHCLVIEDAVAGVRAARAAGMQVIAVATTYPPEELSEADACVPALVGVTIAHYNTEGRPNLEVLFAD